MANPDLLVVFIYPLKKKIPASDDSEIRRSPLEQSKKPLLLLLFMYVGDYTIQFCGDNNKPL